MSFKIKIFAFVMAIGFLTAMSAQEEEAIRCSDYHKGTYTLKNGKTKEGYIFINDCEPRHFQQGLSVIDAKAYNKYKKGKKVKKSIEKFKVKEIKAFALENGRQFHQVKYTNLAATSKLGMLPKRLLLGVAANGPITVYKKFYRTTNGKIEYAVLDANRYPLAERVDWMTSNFEVLIQKDKTKNPVNIKMTNLKKFFGDDAVLMQKYTNKEYEFYNQFQRTSKFGLNCDFPYLNALVEMVNDYNKGSNMELSNTTFDN